VLGKKLGKEFAAFRPLIEKLSSVEVQKIEDGGTVTLNGVTFNSEEILVFRTAKEGTQAVTNRFVTIDLDCTLDQDLIDEGLAREIVSRIQKTRKDSNFNVSDRIEVVVHTSEMLAKVFLKYQSYIASETLMVKGSVSTSRLEGSMVHDIDDEIFEVKAVRV
jgi:isoleucyl-tRNA synthetase